MRASIRLFVKKGIDGTTTADIAKAAGVAEGALYRHFKSKEELAWRLFSDNLNAFTMQLMGKVYPEPTARKRVERFVKESFEAYEDDPELFTYLILREHAELEKYAQRAVHPGHVVTKIVEDGQKTDEIRHGDPMLLGSLFVGAVIRVCVVKMYGNITQDLRHHTKEVAQMIWKMLAC